MVSVEHVCIGSCEVESYKLIRGTRVASGVGSDDHATFSGGCMRLDQRTPP